MKIFSGNLGKFFYRQKTFKIFRGQFFRDTFYFTDSRPPTLRARIFPESNFHLYDNFFIGKIFSQKFILTEGTDFKGIIFSRNYEF